MANSLNGFVQQTLSLTLLGDNDLTDPLAALRIMDRCTWSDGTSGALAARKIYYARRTVTAAADDLDLAGGLTDVLGATITFSALKGIYILNRSSTSGQYLKLGGHASGIAGIFDNLNDILRIPPGISETSRTPVILQNPIDTWTVTAGTGDILKIDPGANTITYDIVLWGY